MEPEQRGRASRASSTSSLGREVRCGCQFYKSDSLLPERRALLFRPSSRTMQQPPAVRCSEHEYEPIAPPSHPAMAPVVRITDTDVMPVADSDDSIDDRGRLPPELILDGDVVLPLDGKIEDSVMEGRELGETGDTSEELDSPTAQEFQDRLEQRFLDASTPYTESRTDGEVNTSQVDSSAIEELPLQRGARSLPQRLKTQAGKLRSQLQRIHRPKFAFAQKRQKPDKKKKTTSTTRSTATSSGKSDSRSRKSMEKRPSRIERLRSSISEKTGKFSLPLDRPRFSLPDKSKFHLPERPKFRLPDKSKFHLPDRPKFNIKKPNIRLPEAFSRVKRPSSTQEGQLSTESTAGSKRNIFDFATYPRIFEKKKRDDSYATSSPKDSRTESAESATFPRARKGKPRWTQRFEDPTYDRPEETAAASDGSPPWHQTSLEEPPRLSARTEEEILAAAQAIPWEDTRKREYYDDEEIQYMDYEQESSERSDRRPAPPRRTHKARREESYEHEEAMEVDPRLYGDQKRVHSDEVEEDEDAAQTDWRADQQAMPEEKFRPIPRSRSLDEDMRAMEQEDYGGAFMAVDPRRFGPRKAASEERGNEMGLEDEENEPSSMQSDREQQASSGSSCDRRRRGVIEEIDSDEFFLRASGISQDDVHLGEYLTDKIRDALRSEDINALDDIELPPTPPQRPRRMRSRRKYKETSVESNEITPPVRPKRERAAARRSREASIVDEVFRERTRSDSRSDSRHRVVYQTEGDQQEPSQEPLDDIVVVKPARRKTRSSSLRSQSQPPIETSILSPPTPDNVVPDALSATPPVVPIRRKRSHRETMMERRNGDVGAPIVCNGHHKWETETETKKPAIPTRPSRSRSRQSLIERLSGRDVMLTSQEDIRNLDAQLHRQDSGPEVVPMPPKRRSRSRTTSLAADEDRTSHGAESLPEAGYVEEDIPHEEENGSMQDLSNGYAMVDKREKPPPKRPPPRRRNKFATLPKPVPPKRPQRAYSTLGPVKKKNIDMTLETISSTHLEPADSAPYIEIDGDEHKDLRSGQVLTKIQGRPLPAPPRPPRMKKEHIERPRTPFEFAEITTATQTDPLPDDMVIEEEVTQAKLIVTPSRSGSQVLVSMERIPSPSRTSTPPVPPLPVSKFFRSEEQDEEEMREEEDIRMEYDTVSLTSPSPIRRTDFDDKHKSAPHLQERIAEESQPRRQLRSGLLSDEPLRISSLEVGDLKVDRLSVSQIEAHKIVASEVDAMMITTSELRGGGSMEDSFSPAIIRELMAIRSHLETVTSQAQERQRERETASHKTTDIPTTKGKQISEQQSEEQQSAELQLAPQKPAEQSEKQELAESHTAQQLLADLQLAQQLLAELQSAKQQSAELQFAQQPAEQQLAESQLTQQKSTESQPEEQQLAESQLTQQSAELQLMQLPAELQPAQQLLADLQLAQQLLAELQSAPQQSAESQLAEQQPAEQPPVEREATESSETDVNESTFTEDAKTEADEDQKVVKTDVIDVRAKKTSHTSSVAQAKDTLSPQTLPIDDLEFKDTNESTTQLLSVAQDIQDKSLRILDSEHPLTLSSTSGSHVVESRASYPPSDVPSAQLSESRVSPERVAESPSSCVQTTATSTATTTELDATSMDLHGNEDNAFDSKEQICHKSRSSSPSKSRSRSSSPKGIVRQTASPVRSLPPAISVTPDTPDSTVSGRGASMNAQPQRAVISYSSNTERSVPKAAQPQRAVISHSFDLEQSLRDRQREFSQSPISSFPLNTTHFIAIPASEIPASFFALNETPTSQHVDSEPGVIDTTQQLLRALRLTGIKAMRHFVRYLTSTISADDTREKVREVELAICALLLLIAGLLIYYFSRTQTVTHLHHWDYFNPPQ